MVIQRFEMCIQLLRLAMEFIIAVAEAIGIVIEQNTSHHRLPSHPYAASVPFVGLLP
ncbi:uncharacterized protein LOC122722193 [Manihot esculenta]|uniref:Uncharacterized protein n=1 Tax=Manihot esculenta TaxID=3983 RepID=A0ACB7G3J5_MANES|nr:uncharacterized protein LOC122722193 [Manihot esculenta]KAG8634864.1 hypothetical protein MANES_17G094900v8 [Manihot esculenta]